MSNTYYKQASFFHSLTFHVWRITLIVLLMIPIAGFSQEAESMRSSDTSIGFKIKSFGIQVDGEFADFDINVILDPQSLEDSYIRARIPVKSISTGISKRDKHLLTEKYFHVEQYPVVEFESKEIIQANKTSYVARGNLMIKGTEQSIEVPLSIQEKGDEKFLTAYFELNRLDYQVGSKNWTMGEIVKIAVSYKFKN